MLSSRFRILAALVAFAAFGPEAAAQTPPPPQTPPPETPPAAAASTPPVPAGPSRVDYGVRFGPSFTTLTSVDTLDATAAAAAFEPTLNFGGFATIRLTGAMAFQPEVIFAAKGHRIRDKAAQPIRTSTGEMKFPAADRVILVRYLEVPLLVRLSKRTHENTSLYLIGGPAFAIRRNAVIREVADPGRHEDIGDLVNGSDFSYIFGAGAQYRRWLVDARFTRGMRNVAAEIPPTAETDPSAEPPAATASVKTVKTGAFSVLMGVRF